MNKFNPEDDKKSSLFANYQQEVEFSKFLNECIKKYTAYIHYHNLGDYEDDLISDTCKAFSDKIKTDTSKRTKKYFNGIGRYKVLDKIAELEGKKNKLTIKYEAHLPEEYTFIDAYSLLKRNGLSEIEVQREKNRLIECMDKIKSDTLNAKESKILDLRFKNDLKFREIDTILGSKAGDSNTVCLRAIEKLKKAYSHIYPKPFST